MSIAIYGLVNMNQYRTINTLDEWNDETLAIVSNEVKVNNINSLESFFSKIRSGKIIIWIGIPFQKIFVNSLNDAKAAIKILKDNIPSTIISNIYIGYERKNGFFIETEYKTINPSVITCEENMLSNLSGILALDKENPIPVSSGIIPFNLCRTSSGDYTTSFSFLIGKGLIIRPFIKLNNEHIPIFNVLLSRINEINEENNIKIDIIASGYAENLAKAFLLYKMGLPDSSAVQLRKLVEALAKDFIITCCKIESLKKLKQACKMLESGKTNVTGAFTELLSSMEYNSEISSLLSECESDILVRLNKDRNFNKIELIKNYVELAKFTGNLGAHTNEVRIRDLDAPLLASSKLISIIENLSNQ